MLVASPKEGLGLVEWITSMFSAASVVVAVYSIIMNRRAAVAAERANTISRESNDLAKDANRVAERAMKLQEDEGLLRLVVKPRMMHVVGDGEDPRPRPVVEIINLSKFPVTIQAIHWKTNEGMSLFWKDPTISSPFGHLPARLPVRESLTALGIPETFRTVEELRSVTAAVAVTACGETIEGMTDEWKKFCGSAELNLTSSKVDDGNSPHTKRRVA